MTEQRGQLLLIEGPDGVGKSTLALKVSSECGAKFRHYGVPVSSDWMTAWGNDARRDAGRYARTVWDRGPFGNLIWPSLLGNGRAVQPYEIGEMTDYLHRYARVRVVILMRNGRDVARTVADRAELAASIDSVGPYYALHRLLVGLGVHVSVWESSAALAAEAESWWQGW